MGTKMETKTLTGCMFPPRDLDQGKVEAQIRANKIQVNYLPTFSVLHLLSADAEPTKWIGLCMDNLRRVAVGLRVEKLLLHPLTKKIHLSGITPIHLEFGWTSYRHLPPEFRRLRQRMTTEMFLIQT